MTGSVESKSSVEIGVIRSERTCTAWTMVACRKDPIRQVRSLYYVQYIGAIVSRVQ